METELPKCMDVFKLLIKVGDSSILCKLPQAYLPPKSNFNGNMDFTPLFP